jgi:hypothetical protein
VCISSFQWRSLLTINCRPQAQPTAHESLKEAMKTPHDEKARKGSVFLDESRRKASVAEMTQNVTGESVACSTDLGFG